MPKKQAKKSPAPALRDVCASLRTVAAFLSKTHVRRHPVDYGLGKMIRRAEAGFKRMQHDCQTFETDSLAEAVAEELISKALERNPVLGFVLGGSPLGHGCIWAPELIRQVRHLVGQQRSAVAPIKSIRMLSGEAWFPRQTASKLTLQATVRNEQARKAARTLTAIFSAAEILLELSFRLHEAKTNEGQIHHADRLKRLFLPFLNQQMAKR